MAKCPRGTICINYFTILLLMIIIGLIIGILVLLNKPKAININQNKPTDQVGLYPRASYSFSNIENDVLLNPYAGPERDNRLFPNSNIISSRIPINIPTQSFDTSYRQIGILTRIGNSKEMILPLIGRPLITNRDKWNFYTMGEKNTNLKLPIKFKNRECMNSLGCDDLYTGDIVKVAGYNDDFKVTTYENNLPKYIPYI